MKTLYCVCAATFLQLVACAPASDFVFPGEGRRQKKLEPIITPPVLPVLEHLERDPSTLLPNEAGFRHANPAGPGGRVKPRFGGGFSGNPSDGGLTASFSSSAGGAGSGHSASQSFSVGFNQQGFSGSQSASFGSGHGFSGSQSSSQAASFTGGSASAAASQAAAFGGNGQTGSQSSSSAFGFNSLNGFQQNPSEFNFGEDIFDVRHGRTRDFPLPGRGRDFPLPGRSRDFPFPGAFGKDFNGVAAFVSSKQTPSRKGRDDILTLFLGDRK